jgi:hypothetical protein
MRGPHSQSNQTTGPSTPASSSLHAGVIQSLRETFTEQTFVEHLKRQAANVEAKAAREAERAHLLAELPKLAATEARLVKRIATIEDDSLVAALKSEWSEAKAQREQAERRAAELEGIERDLAADRAEVEALIETWNSWSTTLAQAGSAADGSVPAEAQKHARQILKKVLVGTNRVKPNETGDWSFAGYTRFEGLVLGGLTHGQTVNYTWPTESGNFDPLGITPISGGSDAGDATVDSTEMAPKPPNARHAPAKPGRSSATRSRGGPGMAPKPPITRHAPAKPGRSSSTRLGRSPTPPQVRLAMRLTSAGR